MEILAVMNGLSVLKHYAKQVCPDYIPDSFPNGTPKHPSQMFLKVEVETNVSEEDYEDLCGLGWRPECDGTYWTLFDAWS